jgi:hypothetical protein
MFLEKRCFFIHSLLFFKGICESPTTISLPFFRETFRKKKINEDGNNFASAPTLRKNSKILNL